MASSSAGDSWGPALSSASTVNAGAPPRGGSLAGASPPPPPSAATMYQRLLSEDPLYTAALEQALRTSALPATLSLQQMLQQRPPPPPPATLRPPYSALAGSPGMAAAAGAAAFPAGAGGAAAASAAAAAAAAALNAQLAELSLGSTSRFTKHTPPPPSTRTPPPPPPPPPLLAPGARVVAAASVGGSAVAAAVAGLAVAAAAFTPPPPPQRKGAPAATPPPPPAAAAVAYATPPPSAKPKPSGPGAVPSRTPPPAPTAPPSGDRRATGARPQGPARASTLGLAAEGGVQEGEDYAASGRLQRGLKMGTLLRGRLRVNAQDPRDAYVTVAGLPSDVMVRGLECRGHALEGDEVALALQPLPQWWVSNNAAPPTGAAGAAGPSGGKGGAGAGNGNGRGGVLRPPKDPNGPEPWLKCGGGVEDVKAEVRGLLEAQPSLKATGRVVAVIEAGARREKVVGVLQFASALRDAAPLPDTGEGPPLLLLPLDPKLPRCRVCATSVKGLPEDLVREAHSRSVESRTLMSARIAAWPADSPLPIAELRCSLGQSGELESETAAILEMEGVRSEEFEGAVLACLPKTPWRIGAEDEKGRRDFRSHRIFSIDPPTAKDLDDALSVEKLPGNCLRIGVHIADVASFIPPFSALDVEAGLRATSVYLVQRVVPMLPRLLCEELCSLNPGVERFAFSVVWDLDANGQILSQWAGRSLIRSCGKLTYPMVQQMIEGGFDPQVHAPNTTIHGGFTWDQVQEDCLSLAGLARTLRAARFSNGALRLDGLKLCFRLDKDGNPLSSSQYVQREANQLVEEYMLLANMAVAGMIAEAFPQHAMLRRHVAPDVHKMQELLTVAAEHNIPLDASTAASLQASLEAFRLTCPDPNLASAITMLATRPMQLASYFCTGDVPEPDGWMHYALAVQQYTHFTSPIRRYPDVVVHRLLAAALDMKEQGLSVEQAVEKHKLLETKLCSRVADHCNDKRLSARKAQDASLRLYLCCLLRRRPVVAEALVINVGGDKYFNVYCPDYGIDLRIHTSLMGVPTRSSWTAGARTLIIDHAGGAGKGNGATGQGQGRGNASGQGQRQGSGATPGEGGEEGAEKLDPCSSHFDYQEWVDHLAAIGRKTQAAAAAAAATAAVEGAVGGSGLDNPRHLMPAMLPLQIKTLTKIPVVLYSPLRPGKISEVIARVYLAEPRPAAPGTEAAEQLPAPGPSAVVGEVAALKGLDEGEPAFSIPWESNLND